MEANAIVRHKPKTVQLDRLALLDSPANPERMANPDSLDKLAKLAPAKLGHPRVNASNARLDQPDRQAATDHRDQLDHPERMDSPDNLAKT